jgi:hypothetical protein
MYRLASAGDNAVSDVFKRRFAASPNDSAAHNVLKSSICFSVG